MAKQQSFENYQPLPFCRRSCPQMNLTLHQDALFGDGRLVERVVTIACANEEICRAERQRVLEEIQEDLNANQKALDK
jgi:hypothetical protein